MSDVPYFIRRMHQIVSVEHQSHESLESELKHAGIALPLQDTVIYRIQGPFFFGVAEKIERALAITHTDPKKIIFRLRDVPFMDLTGLESFHEIIDAYHQRGVKVYICKANDKIRKKPQDAGITETVEGRKVFDTLMEIVNEWH